jgi:hypothetical protein
MVWVVQQTSAQITREWFNFSSGIPSLGGVSQSDLLSSAILRLDGYDRFQARNAAYFRLTQPYQRHTNIPTGPDGQSKFIYLYSFALKPEDEQPSGTLNCSKIDNITWTLTMDPGQLTMERQVYFYAVNYNILRIVGGLGGVAFIA